MAEKSISKSKRICQVEGCNRKYYAKGYCEKHYAQIRKHGKISGRTVCSSNEIIIKDDIAEIVLYDQKCREMARAVIDVEDVEKVSKYKWHTDKSRNTYYAKTNVFISKGKYKHLKMHHVIIGKPAFEYEIDHRDNNGLNNQRYNLRIVTHRQNHQNRMKHSFSKYPGVSYDQRRKNPWKARITINGKEKWLGSFSSEEEAFTVYRNAVHLNNEKCLGRYES